MTPRATTLLLAHEAAMRTGQFDRARNYANQAAGLLWEAWTIATAAADRAENARLAQWEQNHERRVA